MVQFSLKLGFGRYSLPKQGYRTKQTKPPKQNKTKQNSVTREIVLAPFSFTGCLQFLRGDPGMQDDNRSSVSPCASQNATKMGRFLGITVKRLARLDGHVKEHYDMSMAIGARS